VFKMVASRFLAGRCLPLGMPVGTQYHKHVCGDAAKGNIGTGLQADGKLCVEALRHVYRQVRVGTACSR